MGHTLSTSASVPEKMAIPRKAMRTSASKRKSIMGRGIMAKSVVFRGSKEKTTSGLTKSMLHKNKRGKIVSKRQTAAGRMAYSKIAPWTKACSQAKKSVNYDYYDYPLTRQEKALRVLCVEKALGPLWSGAGCAGG